MGREVVIEIAIIAELFKSCRFVTGAKPVFTDGAIKHLRQI